MRGGGATAADLFFEEEEEEQQARVRVEGGEGMACKLTGADAADAAAWAARRSGAGPSIADDEEEDDDAEREGGAAAAAAALTSFKYRATGPIVTTKSRHAGTRLRSGLSFFISRSKARTMGSAAKLATSPGACREKRMRSSSSPVLAAGCALSAEAGSAQKACV